MNSYVSVRRLERPDRPQPVYKGAVSLWEAPLYAPIGAAQQNAWRVDRRLQDRTLVLQTVPDDGWVPVLVDTIVRTWSGIFGSELAGTRSADRRLDRTYLQQTVPDDGWIFANLPATVTTAQLWPGILANLPLSYRSADRAKLDLVRTPWAPDDGWVAGVVDSVVRTWTGIFGSELAGTRTADRILDRTYLSQTVPDDGWIFANLPGAVSTAQLWPAILANVPLSYRSGDRAKLDLVGTPWAPDDGWIPQTVDTVTRTWSAIFGAELASTRTGDRRQDRTYLQQTVPNDGWIVATLPGTATTAQLWPALLQDLAPGYRSPDRARLDVRGQEWSPQFGWVQRVVDATVSKWAPVFDAELGYRSPDRARLDVRADTDRPELATWAAFLTFVAPIVATTEVTATYVPSTSVIATSLSDTAYPDRILWDGATYYWRLEETSGTFVDVINPLVGGGTHNLTAVDGANFTYHVAGIRDSYGLQLGAAHGRSRLFAFPVLTAPYSLETWLIPGAGRVQSGLIVGAAASPPTGVFLETDGTIRLNPNVSVTGTSAVVLPNGSLAHVVVTVSAISGGLYTIRFYINGVLDTAGTYTTAVAPTMSVTVAFNSSSPTGPVTLVVDLIDELALYAGVELTAAQIAAHYAARLSLSLPLVVATSEPDVTVIGTVE